MVMISESCLRAAVCLFPNAVILIVGVGLKRVWMRSVTACSAVSCEDLLGTGSVSGGNYVVSENLYLAVLGGVWH